MRRRRIQRTTDLFARTRLRLTWTYSVLLSLFLILFIAIVYGLLYWTIFADQRNQLVSTLEQETEAIENRLGNTSLTELTSTPLMRDVDQFFYYVVTPDGQVLAGDEQVPASRDDLLRALSDMELRPNATEEVAVFIEEPGRGRFERDHGRGGNEQTVRLLTAGAPILQEGQTVAFLYIGKDLTFAYQVLRWVPLLLGGLAVLFLGLAFLLSSWMSKRAMAPIAEAYTRQREFVADASHELRTPLSVMLASINLMEMDANATQAKPMKTLKNEVKRMSQLVGDLLTLARSDSGTLDIQPVPLDLTSVIRQAVEALAPLAKEKQVTLEAELPMTLPMTGDIDRLMQLAYILIHNAVQYTPSGGRIKVMAEAAGHHAVFRVTDTGIGMTPEEAEKIFDRFYRADKARSRQHGGHGLGLSIAKWIVERHGGKIDVVSDPGHGSVFTCTFPIMKRG